MCDNNIAKSDVEKCRTCLGPLELPINLFETSYSGLLNVLESLLTFQVYIQGKEFNVCRHCEEKLVLISEFQVLCSTSIEKLHNDNNSEISTVESVYIKSERSSSPDIDPSLSVGHVTCFLPVPPIKRKIDQVQSFPKDKAIVKKTLHTEKVLSNIQNGNKSKEGECSKSSFANIHSRKKQRNEETQNSVDVNKTCTPELRDISITYNVLTLKSREAYEREYQQFEAWLKEENIESISENVLLAYFDMQSKSKKISTLWTMYSMLRTCLNVFKNVDISQYVKLQTRLKTMSSGYEPKKSKILEIEDINRFIKEGDDQLYLATKIVLIMGYNGGCRREELTNMSIDDVEYQNDAILVTIPKTKNNLSRIFVITENIWINLIKKYAQLRPSTVTHRRFFITYRNGYCISCPMGINTIGHTPKIIAEFLKLPNPELFTGHCFRRSSMSHLANSGSDLVTIKRHRGWKSSNVAEDTTLKRQIAADPMISAEPSTSTNLKVPKTETIYCVTEDYQLQ